jgi:hypothetical protein
MYQTKIPEARRPCGFDLVVVGDRSAAVHKNIAGAVRGAALRLRHPQRDQKGQRSNAKNVPRLSAATASKNKVTTESLQHRAEHRLARPLPVNLRAQDHKKAQIFDPLPSAAATKRTRCLELGRARHLFMAARASVTQ